MPRAPRRGPRPPNGHRTPIVLAALLSLGLAASCGTKAKPEDPGPDGSPSQVVKGPPFPGKPTSALVQRPEIAALVDDLAKEKTLESSHIGAGGSPSAVYAKFVAIKSKATDDELVALLQHESPVVRGYAAQHIAHEVPARVAALVPLASDATGVPTLSGCIGGMDTMARVVREALCYSQLPEAGGVLVSISQQGGPEASEALACAAPLSPVAASEAAARALKASPKKADEAAYLRVLAIAPTPDAADGCALARARATSDDASVQIGVAQALWRCDDDASQKVLVDLAAGRNVVVGRHAKASLFLAFPARRPDFAGDRDVMGEVSQRLGQTLRSPEGTKRSLAIVEPLALAYPANLGEPFHRAAVTPDTTQAALRIAAKLPPNKLTEWGSVRTGVIAYLARTKDPAAAPELRRSLESGDTLELQAAIRGIEALKDKASRPAMEKLTSHSDPEVARLAKQALSVL